jgi:hypothetical protein
MSEMRLVISPPAGWRVWIKDATLATFVPAETPTPIPGVGPNLRAELLVTSNLIRDRRLPKEQLGDPNKTSLLTWMDSGTKIVRIQKVGVFDSGNFGELPIWLIQGEGYSYYLVLIVTDEVEVEVALRSENRAFTGKEDPRLGTTRVLQELESRLGALKELVRSMRLVKAG